MKRGPGGGPAWRASRLNVLEAIAYGFKHHTEVFASMGVPLHRALVTNGGSRSVLWKQILADEGWVVGLLSFLNLLPGGSIINTPVAVVAGLTYNFLPFMVLPIYASLERADPRVIEAGGDLYANGFTTFRTVTLPMSMPGVLAGTLLTFIPAAGDFVNMELLGPQRGKMVGNVINDQFLAIPGGYPVAAALSFTLMAAILAMVFLYVRRFGTEELV